jgi:ABC-2 type transport system ATP-binding protein
MEQVLNVDSLFKTFGDFVAVDRVSFSLKNGEILGFLGQNGAGKTTTIQMLLGVLTPTSGRISFLGKDFVQHRSELLEKINFSSTYTNLPFGLKVKDALHFISYLYKLPDRKKRVAELVDIFNLGRLLDQRIASLSAGEQTRLNLAKAFINSPSILLLDEPTASLDPENAQTIRDFIIKERREHGLSVLFTSHNMTEVEEICDRVIFIQSGRITLDDTPYNLARKLDLSTVRLLLDTDSAPFQKLISGRGIQIERIGPEISIKMKESEVPQFINSLVNEKIDFHGLTVTRAGLEEYFFKDRPDNSGKKNA